MPAEAPNPEPGRGVRPNAPTFISVVVVNYNGRAYLEGCLRTLTAQTGSACEIIVVDNASTDGSTDTIAAHFAEISDMSKAKALEGAFHQTRKYIAQVEARLAKG